MSEFNIKDVVKNVEMVERYASRYFNIRHRINELAVNKVVAPANETAQKIIDDEVKFQIEMNDKYGDHQ